VHAARLAGGAGRVGQREAWRRKPALASQGLCLHASTLPPPLRGGRAADTVHGSALR